MQTLRYHTLSDASSAAETPASEHVNARIVYGALVNAPCTAIESNRFHVLYGN
jgi:hypothetical protein